MNNLLASIKQGDFVGVAIRIELGKALKNKWFYLATGLACFISFASAVGNVIEVYTDPFRNVAYTDTSYIPLAPNSLYHFWIVTDFIQPATELFFLLLPLIAVLPYSWSLASEFKSGSIKNVLTRTTRLAYFGSKFLATFASGALSVGIPVVLNFLVCACIMPAYSPDITAVLYSGITDRGLFSQLYYSVPLLYSFLMTLINFLFGGLWAMVVMSLAFFIKNRITLLLAPFLVLLFLKFLESQVFSFNTHFGLTPFSYLRGAGGDFFSNGWIVLIEYVGFLIFVSSVVLLFKKRDVL